VAHLLLNSAHALITWLYGILLPLLLAIWPLVRPIFLKLWDYMHALGTIVSPYFHASASTTSDVVAYIVNTLWTNLIETDPVVLAACGIMFLLSLVGRYLYVEDLKKGDKGRIRAATVWWNGYVKGWNDWKKEKIDNLRKNSIMAANAAMAFSFILVPAFIFAGILLVEHLIPPLTKVAEDHSLKLLAGIFAPVVRASYTLRRDKQVAEVVEWCQYACVVGTIVFIYRAAVTLPLTERVFNNMPLKHEMQLSVLLWIIAPSSITGGTPAAFKVYLESLLDSIAYFKP